MTERGLKKIINIKKKIVKGRVYYYEYRKGKYIYLGTPNPKWGKKFELPGFLESYPKSYPKAITIPEQDIKQIASIIKEAIRISKKRRHGEWKYFMKIARILNIEI